MNKRRKNKISPMFGYEIREKEWKIIKKRSLLLNLVSQQKVIFGEKWSDWLYFFIIPRFSIKIEMKKNKIFFISLSHMICFLTHSNMIMRKHDHCFSFLIYMKDHNSFLPNSLIRLLGRVWIQDLVDEKEKWRKKLMDLSVLF